MLDYIGLWQSKWLKHLNSIIQSGEQAIYTVSGSYCYTFVFQETEGITQKLGSGNKHQFICCGWQNYDLIWFIDLPFLFFFYAH